MLRIKRFWAWFISQPLLTRLLVISTGVCVYDLIMFLGVESLGLWPSTWYIRPSLIFGVFGLFHWWFMRRPEEYAKILDQELIAAVIWLIIYLILPLFALINIVFGKSWRIRIVGVLTCIGYILILFMYLIAIVSLGSRSM